MKDTVLVVCGPTASGKTAFAVQMAKRLQSEVISADCMLIYKGLTIGTAKPSERERCGITHHMIDILSPDENFSASDYAELSVPICERILKKGRVPVICGGTGFYIQSLLFRRSLGNIGSDSNIRARYEKIAEEKGNIFLHEKLTEIDPESAAVLHPNDVKRVIRALEIYELTGRKKSLQQDGFTPRFSYVAVAFNYPREELYSRIDQRVDQMLAEGLVDEVSALLASGVGKDCQSMCGIGYKEVVQYLENKISYSTMREIIQKNSRNYAKRQITFFKKLPGLIWLDPRKENNLNVVEDLLCKQSSK